MHPTDHTAASAPPALCIIGPCDVAIWGLSAEERTRRLFAGHGVATTIAEADLAAAPKGRVMLVRADYVMEDSVAAALLAAKNTILTAKLGGGGAPVAFAANVPAMSAPAVAAILRTGARPDRSAQPAGVTVRDYADITPRYNYELRKRERPYVLPLDREHLREIERRTFMGAYKGVTDFVTKFVWPVPALWVTRWAAKRHITPNMVTTAGLLLVVVAFLLFAAGHFWLGLAAGWAMTFFDTVDGKLARVTFTASKWGKHYDHVTDIIHPPLWWGAWWYGARAVAEPSFAPVLDVSAYFVIGGYVAERLIEEAFKRLYKVRIHVWERIDSIFRLITARRNPNLAILSVATLLGEPAHGFVAVAGWTAFSVAFHAVRFVQAGRRWIGGRPLVSWLSDPKSGAA